MTREDYEASEDDNQLVTGVAGDEGGLGYFGFSYYEQNAGQAQPGRRRRRRGGCVKPRTDVDPGRLLQAALAPAVHVPVRQGARSGPRSRRSWSSSSTTTTTIAKASKIVPMTDEQAGEAKTEVDKLAGTPSPMAEPRPLAVGGPASPGPRTPRLGSRQAVKVAPVRAPRRSPSLTTVCIVGSLLLETISFFGDVPIGDFLFGTKWSPLFARRPAVLRRAPAAVGHALPAAIGLVVAIPLGLLAAIYLSEYAPPRVRKVDQAGARAARRRPDDRVRLLRADVLHPDVLQDFLGIEVSQFNALSAGIIMGLLVLPTIASIAEDAMSAVPHRCARARSASAPASCRSRCGSSSRPRSRASSPRCPRRLARRRRDGDHPRRRRPVAEPRRRPARELPVDGGVHRRHVARRHPDRLDRVQDDLRRRLDAVRHDARR